MTVLRIVPNLAGAPTDALRAFYEQLFDLRPVMDLGWIVTLAAQAPNLPQLSLASQGGSGTPVPDLTFEVDNLGEVHGRAVALRCEIVYGIVVEPWGVRRFFVRDPGGRTLNVMTHDGSARA